MWVLATKTDQNCIRSHNIPTNILPQEGHSIPASIDGTVAVIGLIGWSWSSSWSWSWSSSNSRVAGASSATSHQEQGQQISRWLFMVHGGIALSCTCWSIAYRALVQVLDAASLSPFVCMLFSVKVKVGRKIKWEKSNNTSDRKPVSVHVLVALLIGRPVARLTKAS